MFANILCLFRVQLVIDQCYIRQSVLVIFLICIQDFPQFTSELIRHYVLANLISSFGVHLVIRQ